MMTPLLFLKAATKPLLKTVAFAQGTAAAFWTFPAVLGSAILIAWGAEAAQFLISQGLALAILAWLQTLPEFAVEAVIAWEAGKVVAMDPNSMAAIHATSLMTANFTGSLRLLVGLGWPMIYATAAFFYRRNNQGKKLDGIELEDEHSVEVVFLLICIMYFCIVYVKGTLSWVDSLLLTLIYAVYLVFLNKIPPQEEEKMDDLDRIPRFILRQRRIMRNSIIGALFVGGGAILYFSAHPFLESLKGIALSLGISTFVFVQWVAPFLSEFPEKVSAFNWARRVTTAPLAVMNMVSSNINQWTMLVAMLPLAYAFALGGFGTIVFDEHQKLEILMTIGQSLLGALLLSNMRFSWWEAALLFALWLIQFMLSGFEKPQDPGVEFNAMAAQIGNLLSTTAQRIEVLAHRGKEIITALYFVWSAILLIAGFFGRGFKAIQIFPRLIREHW
jgi:cation:H+ antiporter